MTRANRRVPAREILRGSTPETTLALNARNLALAHNSGYTNVVCTCPTSYGNLKECMEELKDEMTKNSINAVLDTIGVVYKNDLRVFHAAEVLHSLRETLKKRSRGSLNGVRVATHQWMSLHKDILR